MIATLHRHAQSVAAPDVELAVELSRFGDRLRLAYTLTGDVGALRLPPVSAPRRADELWRATCFEVFVCVADGGYYEFNLAPSTEWAAYRFSGYRSGMSNAGGLDAPRIQGVAGACAYQLRAELNLGPLPDLPNDQPWRLGLSAVVQDGRGAVSYWALAHPPGKPDFHHPDSFVLDLPPPEKLPDPA